MRGSQAALFLLAEIPLFRVAIAITIGIVLGNYATAIFSPWFFIPALLLGLVLVLVKATKQIILRTRALWVYLVFGFFAFWLTQNKNQTLQQQFNEAPKTDTTWLVSLQENAVEKTFNWQAKAKIWAIDANGNPRGKPIKVLIHFENNQAQSKLPQAGTILVAYGSLKTPQEPAHESMFSYRDYLWKRGILFHLPLFPDAYQVSSSKNNNLTAVMANWQQQLRYQLAKHLNREQAALAAALLIGYTHDLQKAEKTAFSETGTIHLLAVSGMHVGLIFGIILLLLNPLQKRGFKWFTFFLAIAWLWLYVLITGAPASAVRAATMFSLGFFAKNLHRNTNIYNIIAFAYVAILLSDPYMLFHTGFQLSFAAVIGIVSWYSFFQNLYVFDNKILKYIWNLGVLAVVAQLATLPLTLHYFNQFPVYFLPANIVVVCMVVVAVHGLLLFLAVSFIPYVSFWLGEALNFWLNLILKVNMWFAELPHALITGIQIPMLWALCLLLLLYAFIFAIRYREKLALFTGLGISLIVVLGIGFDLRKQQNRQNLYTLETYGGRMSLLIQGKGIIVASDSALFERNKQTLNRFYELMGIEKNRITVKHAPRYHQTTVRNTPNGLTLQLEEIPKFDFDGNQRFVSLPMH